MKNELKYNVISRNISFQSSIIIIIIGIKKHNILKCFVSLLLVFAYLVIILIV